MVMDEAHVRFEREDHEGVVPVGTYLVDAARRFGIRFKDECIDETCDHKCAVEIVSGADHLSVRTQAETEFFDKHGGNPMRRLACQTKIATPGEIVIMTDETKKEAAETEEETEAERAERYKKEFAEMPLERKIADLVRFEAMTLSETFTFVMNSPFKVGEKLLDVLAEFGFKKEETERATARPAEHRDEPKAETNGTGAKEASVVESVSDNGAESK